MDPMEGSRPVARVRSVKAQELNCLDPVVGVDDCAARLRMAVDVRHAQHIGGQGRGGRGVDGPAQPPYREGVEDHRAVHLAFHRGVFSDVGDPQLVAGVPGEVAFHQVRGRGRLPYAAGATAARQALQAGPLHQQFYGAVADADT
jgi:hypothetical protein